MTLPDKITRGGSAEDLARRFLEERGLRLLQRNYRCRCGELDLIMCDGAYVVFVEVRFRSSDRYGSPAETITTAKRKRLIRTASYYLQQRRFNNPCRFDIIGVTLPEGANCVEWIRDAFAVT